MVQDWRSKDLVDPFSTVGDLRWDVGQPLAFCPSAFQLQNEDSEEHEVSFFLNIAIHLFSCGHFCPDTESGGRKNSRGRWNVLFQKCPSGNTGCELSHVYRMLSGCHTKVVIIIRVYSWKGLMNAFVQWKEYNHSLINLHARSWAGYTFQCFVLLFLSQWFFKAIENLQPVLL